MGFICSCYVISLQNIFHLELVSVWPKMRLIDLLTNFWYKAHQIPKLKCFSSRLAAVFAIPLKPCVRREWRCSWSSADMRWSNYISVFNTFIIMPTIMLTKVQLILALWRYMISKCMVVLIHIYVEIKLDDITYFYADMSVSKMYCYIRHDRILTTIGNLPNCILLNNSFSLLLMIGLYGMANGVYHVCQSLFTNDWNWSIRGCGVTKMVIKIDE